MVTHLSYKACHEEFRRTVFCEHPHDDVHGHLLTGWVRGRDA